MLLKKNVIFFKNARAPETTLFYHKRRRFVFYRRMRRFVFYHGAGCFLGYGPLHGTQAVRVSQSCFMCRDNK